MPSSSRQTFAAAVNGSNQPEKLPKELADNIAFVANAFKNHPNTVGDADTFFRSLNTPEYVRETNREIKLKQATIDELENNLKIY